MPDLIRLLLVDDSYQVRQSVKAMLDFAADAFVVVGEAENGAQAVELAAQLHPDVVLMDVNMPVMDGITATAKLMASSPAGVVIVSVQGEQEYLRRAMQAGARDYLIKPFSCEELLAALRGAAVRPQTAAPAGDAAPAAARPPGKVLTVFSTKGGTGKTTVVANLSAALSRGGKVRVAAVDLDLEFGTLATMMGVRPHGSILDLCRVPGAITAEHLTRVLVRQSQSGTQVLAAPPQPHLASEVDGSGRADPNRSHISEIIDSLRETHDYVVIDTSASFREANLIALDKADLILMLTQPEITALESTAKGLDVLLERLEYPREKVQVVLNRSDSAGGLSLTDISTSLGVPLAHLLPSDPEEAAQAANTGIPLVLRRAKQGPLGEALSRLAEAVAAGESPAAVTAEPAPAKEPAARRQAFGASPLKRLFGLI